MYTDLVFFYLLFSPSPFPSSHCSFLFWKPRFPLPSGCTHHMSLYSSDLYEQLHNSMSSHTHTYTHTQHVFKHTNISLSLFYPPHSLPSLSALNPLTIFMIQPSFFAISRGPASLPRICWTSTLPPIFTCLFLLHCPPLLSFKESYAPLPLYSLRYVIL